MACIHSIPTASIFTIVAALGLYTLPAQSSDSFRNVNSSIEYNYRVAGRSKPSLNRRDFPKYLDESKPTINGFHLGTKDREIYKKLGKPTRKKNTFGLDPYGGCRSHAISIYYSGLEILLIPTFKGGKQIGRDIYTIIDTDPRYTTNMGFKVGDNINKAEEVFSGLVHTSKTVNNRKTIEVPGMTGWGEGVVVEAGTDDKIKKIELSYGCP